MRLGHILIVCRPEQPPVVPTVIGHRQASVFAILPHELGVQQLDPPVSAKPPQALHPGSSVTCVALAAGDSQPACSCPASYRGPQVCSSANNHHKIPLRTAQPSIISLRPAAVQLSQQQPIEPLSTARHSSKAPAVAKGQGPMQHWHTDPRYGKHALYRGRSGSSLHLANQ